MLTPRVIQELEHKVHGKDGEILLTEAVGRLMEQGELVLAPPIEGYIWSQVGSPVNWLKANIEIAKRHDKYKGRVGELAEVLGILSLWKGRTQHQYFEKIDACYIA